MIDRRESSLAYSGQLPSFLQASNCEILWRYEQIVRRGNQVPASMFPFLFVWHSGFQSKVGGVDDVFVLGLAQSCTWTYLRNVLSELAHTDR